MKDEADKLVERLTPALKLLEGLKTGQRCADYAFAEADGFQAMTYLPHSFEALRALPEALARITELGAQIAAKDAALEQVEDRVEQASKMYHNSQQWLSEDGPDGEHNLWEWIFAPACQALKQECE